MHAATADVLRYFNHDHLPEKLQEVARPFTELANDMANRLPEVAQTTRTLQKLVEAKDCAVRAALDL